MQTLNIPHGQAICYSGFRPGQAPGHVYPSYLQVKEDLTILQKDWKYLRLYDCDPHMETVLQVIRNEGFEFKVLLGAYIVAEMNNYGCPWGGVYSSAQLFANRDYNETRINRLIDVANQYNDIVVALSTGNEACVDWTDHYVSPERVVEYVRHVKANTDQPVTFCENYVPWLNKLRPLSEEVDFISIHTYPVWEYKKIHEALEYTKSNYYAVANAFPETPVVITEAGWATNSNGRGIDPHHVSEEFQRTYINELLSWSNENEILTFVFEAFDESWKGSPDPMEPEKHWGLYYENRQPKLLFQKEEKSS